VHYTFKNENDVTCIINGAFQEDAVRKFLDKFIEKYILCPSCKYPEMFIKVLVRSPKLGP
jgi:translation initiation factor 5